MGPPPASANDRDHWRVKARKVAEIRYTANVDARLFIHWPLDRIAVGLTYVPRDKRRRDPDNLVVPLFKALCDDPDPDTDDGMTLVSVAAIRAALGPVLPAGEA